MYSVFQKLIGLACIALVVVACNQDDKPQIGEDNLFFVGFEVENDTIYFEDGVNNYGNGPGIDTYEDSVGRLHSQFTTFIRSALDSNYTSNILTVQMVKFLTDTLFPSYNTSYLLFDEGTYNYGSWNEDSTSAGIDGAVITYTDSNEKTWSSNQLYGNQENWASFEITSHKPVEGLQFGAKTKGNFNCLVFDGLGGYLDLRNGQFHARTIYQQ